MTDDIEQLLAFGRIGLETGYYEQARDYFEQVFALDPSNREAMRGLARVNEILGRREALAAEPIQEKPVKLPHEVERKRHILEEETEEQDRSLVQWFKLRQSELWKIAIAGVPLLFLLCAGLANMINPTPEATPTVVATATLAPTPIVRQTTTTSTLISRIETANGYDWWAATETDRIEVCRWMDANYRDVMGGPVRWRFLFDGLNEFYRTDEPLILQQKISEIAAMLSLLADLE
jgi:tetratricopeptide (TPR) repeat protein